MPRQRQRKGPRRRSTKSMGKASLALKIAKKALRVNKPELKAISNLFQLEPQVGLGTISNLAAVTQGDGFVNRDGRNVSLKSIHLRGNILQNVTSSATLVRILLVKFKDVDQQIPTISEVLNTVSTISQRNLDRQNDMVVLSDRTYSLSDGSKPQIFWNLRKSFGVNGLKQQYVIGSTGGAFTNIETNAIFIITLSDSPLGDQPQINFTSRIRFTDV